MNPIIRKRRSCRVFEAREVEQDKLQRILAAGMQAPSAHNFQPWEFLIVRDPEKRAKIAALSRYGQPAAKCDTCIVSLANMERVAKESLWWQQDMGACVENMLLQAENEGLGAVWLGYYPEPERVDGMAKLFGLPENLITFAVIALGYPGQELPEADRFDASRVHYESYHA